MGGACDTNLIGTRWGLFGKFADFSVQAF